MLKKTSETTPTMASIVNSYSTSTQDGYSCDYVNGNIGKSIYTNTETTFTEQDVNIDLTPYSYIEIIFYTETVSSNWKYVKSTGKILNVAGYRGTMGDYVSNDSNTSAPQYFGRNFTLYASKIAFTNGYNYNGSTYSNRNSSCVPLVVIGYK